jgi:hypothetical protein
MAPRHVMVALLTACFAVDASAQREGFSIRSWQPGTVFDAVGECSMGEVNVRIEPNVTFHELRLSGPEEEQQLRFEVYAVHAGRIVGRFDDGEICALRIMVRPYHPGIMDVVLTPAAEKGA